MSKLMIEIIIRFNIDDDHLVLQDARRSILVQL